MNAGSLRHLITIQNAVPGSPDAFGQRVISWSTFATLYAAIEPQTGRQLEYARSFAATVTHKITTRYVPGILPTMRVQFGTRIFTINAAINPEERCRELNLYCTETVAT